MHLSVDFVSSLECCLFIQVTFALRYMSCKWLWCRSQLTTKTELAAPSRANVTHELLSAVYCSCYRSACIARSTLDTCRLSADQCERCYELINQCVCDTIQCARHATLDYRYISDVTRVCYPFSSAGAPRGQRSNELDR